MKSIYLFIVLILSFLSIPAHTGDFQGQYTAITPDGEFTLVFENTGNDSYSGKLSGNGIILSLQGIAKDGSLQGRADEEFGAVIFEVVMINNTLNLTLTEIDESNNPIPGTSQVLVFQRLSENSGMKSGKTEKGEKVVINNIKLTEQQITELENTYGVKPLPGNYWYDSNSGLYGVEGFQAYGFMYAGHSFGRLSRKASAGNSGVFVNGRELPQSEWAIWSYIIGYWIQAGSYWLDEKGNAGYEGNPTPVINLYAAAQQNAYNGRGGAGDNFWSSRFSAGNYDSGNQRGYVSVPGYGPVGYGF